jgi:hypothetical protein
MVDMDGRVLRAAGDVTGGDVDAATEFRFRQAGDMVWGRYSGGAIRLGFLVGTSDGAALRLRYSHLNTAGETASGHTVDRVEELADGRVRLHEAWQWDSRDGSGSSVLEEQPIPARTGRDSA